MEAVSLALVPRQVDHRRTHHVQATFCLRASANTLFNGQSVSVGNTGNVYCADYFNIATCMYFYVRCAAAIIVQGGDIPRLVFGPGTMHTLFTVIGDTVTRRAFNLPIAGVGISESLLYVVTTDGVVWVGETLFSLAPVISRVQRVPTTPVWSSDQGVAFGTADAFVVVSDAGGTASAQSTECTLYSMRNIHSAGWNQSLKAWIVLLNAGGDFPTLVFIMADGKTIRCGTDKNTAYVTHDGLVRTPVGMVEMVPILNAPL